MSPTLPPMSTNERRGPESMKYVWCGETLDPRTYKGKHLPLSKEAMDLGGWLWRDLRDRDKAITVVECRASLRKYDLNGYRTRQVGGEWKVRVGGVLLAWFYTLDDANDFADRLREERRRCLGL